MEESGPPVLVKMIPRLEFEMRGPSGVGAIFRLSQLYCVRARIYSGFDSVLYRRQQAKWHFPQENATSHDLKL